MGESCLQTLQCWTHGHLLLLEPACGRLKDDLFHQSCPNEKSNTHISQTPQEKRPVTFLAECQTKSQSTLASVSLGRDQGHHCLGMGFPHPHFETEHQNNKPRGWSVWLGISRYRMWARCPCSGCHSSSSNIGYTILSQSHRSGSWRVGRYPGSLPPPPPWSSVICRWAREGQDSSALSLLSLLPYFPGPLSLNFHSLFSHVGSTAPHVLL